MNIVSVEHEARKASRCGLYFVRNKAGGFASDNDVALWTGVRLAQVAMAYEHDPTVENMEEVRYSLGGVEILVNSLGRGVLSRWAFPLAGSWEAIGYDKEASLAHEGNTFGDRIRAGNIYESGSFVYETRTTRDQLSGILYGLAAAWKHCPHTRPHVGQLARALRARFEETNWSLRDHNDSTGGTSAHRVDAAQRLVLKALCHATGFGPSRKPESWWFRFLPFVTMHYNRRFQNVYSHLLNSLDAHSLLMLEEHHGEGKRVRKWWKKIFKQMKDDRSPHFEAINIAFGGQDNLSYEAWVNLDDAAAIPYNGSYRWNKGHEKWWSRQDEPTVGFGLDVMLPYYIDRVS